VDELVQFSRVYFSPAVVNLTATVA